MHLALHQGFEATMPLYRAHKLQINLKIQQSMSYHHHPEVHDDYTTPPEPALERFSSGSRSEHDQAPRQRPRHHSSSEEEIEACSQNTSAYGIRRTSKSLRKSRRIRKVAMQSCLMVHSLLFAIAVLDDEHYPTYDLEYVGISGTGDHSRRYRDGETCSRRSARRRDGGVRRRNHDFIPSTPDRKASSYERRQHPAYYDDQNHQRDFYNEAFHTHSNMGFRAREYERQDCCAPLVDHRNLNQNVSLWHQNGRIARDDLIIAPPIDRYESLPRLQSYDRQTPWVPDEFERASNVNPGPIMVEIEPGTRVPLRGAEETAAAVASEEYRSVTCLGCAASIFCIRDCQYCFCPECKVVTGTTSVSNSFYDEKSGSMVYHRPRPYGLGLGFTRDGLIQIQQELKGTRR